MAKPGSSRGRKSEGGEKKQAKPSDVGTSGNQAVTEDGRLRQGGTVPRSNVWVCGTRFKTCKSELHRNPFIDAVDLALLFFGPRHNALDLFVGRGFGLQAALGNGVVTDIVGWIKSFHPVSMHDERARATSTEVVIAFGKRLYNMRKSMDPGEGTSGVQSKDLVFESDDGPL
ncbi:hypothetical protein RvY_11404 [Ramazzottius varieornatus]|uniref:Uncharacterized protein n=1 Tax=Ramazzottius varieornatus TaxID=947166 RepID=A0A1D1VFZ6_RAMVA|nr:hypothetical protein RvY_11404 [Ramazzottius varieornatus]